MTILVTLNKLSEFDKKRINMGMEYKIALVINNTEVWFRTGATAHIAKDALLYNLQNGIEIEDKEYVHNGRCTQCHRESIHRICAGCMEDNRQASRE